MLKLLAERCWTGLRTVVSRGWVEARERFHRRAFMMRVWNDIDPKDPHLLSLFVGDATTLKQAVLGLCGSDYIALDRERGGIELYSAWGVRITGWSAQRLFLLRVREATMLLGRPRRSRWQIAARAVAVALAILVVYIAARPRDESMAMAPKPSASASSVDTLIEHCSPEAPCSLERALATGEMSRSARDRLEQTGGLVVAGFRPNDATVPPTYLAALAAIDRIATCRDVVLIGRSSPDGNPARNLELAALRARAVRDTLASGRARRFATLIARGDSGLELDLQAVRADLDRARIPYPREAELFAAFARRSVQVICLNDATIPRP